jgi:Zn finger protein HypA/HybF involved in hydrogenase expression
MEEAMKRSAAVLVLVISIVPLAGGLLFLCAAARQPTRLFLALALLVLGGGLAAWSGRTLRRLRELDPEHLSDRITVLARAGGHAEVTLSQVVGELRIPDEAALEALASLQGKGQCYREHREGREFYVFPGLKETKVARRCVHCGSEFSVKTPLQKCPNCGGSLELERR